MGGATINPVQWAEGALLTPQHFQHLTRCWRLESSYYLNYMSPFYWGVTGFKYDEALLVSGKFRILEIDAILPDGLVISSTGTSETALELDLKAISDQMVEKPLTIYLAVPAYRPNEANVSGDFPRYHSVEGKPSINDETGEGAVSIPELKPILSLVPSNEALPPRYVSIPLVQAQYKDDAFTLTPFIAPRLYLEQESTLGQIISPILKQLREKAAFLSEKVSSLQIVEEAAVIQEFNSILTTITRAVPPLEALLLTNKTHPYVLYVALCQLAGELGTLRKGQVPPIFAAYNHNDLHFTFNQVITFIDRMIALIQENYTVIPFALEKDQFNLQLQPDWVSEDYFIIGIRQSLDMVTKDVVDWLNEAVIASETYVKSVRDKRILGTERSLIEADEEMQLVAPKGVVLVKVKKDSAFINPDEKLFVFNLSDTEENRPSEIVLYVQKKS